MKDVMSLDYDIDTTVKRDELNTRAAYQLVLQMLVLGGKSKQLPVLPFAVQVS